MPWPRGHGLYGSATNPWIARRSATRTQVSVGSRSQGNPVAHPGLEVLHMELDLKM